MRFFVFKLLLVCSFVFAVGALFNGAHASEESKAFVVRGIEELKKRDYNKAVQEFDNAINADKADQQAAFFKAVALNRMGRFGDSRRLLMDLKKDNFNHLEFDFEFGWSLMGVRSWQEALSAFEKYDKEHPGRGQTMEFMGRCYLFTGELDKADKAFREALLRDPNLKPTVELSLALLETKRNNKEAALKHLDAALETDSSLGRALRGMFGAPTPQPEPKAEPEAEQKNFGIAVSAFVGHNDNVIGLGTTTPLPADITHKDSAFERFSANASYNRQMTNASGTIGYAFLADTYNSLSKANVIDNYVYADYARSFSEKLSGSMRLSYENTIYGGHRFREQYGVRTAAAYRFTQGSATEAYYSYGLNDYKQASPVDAWRRDGHTDTVGLTHYIFMADKGIASLGYSHAWNRATGTDLSFESDSISARISRKLFMEITGEAGYTYTKDAYNNQNTLSPGGFARSDHSDNFMAQLLRPIYKGVNVSIQYQGTRAHSNIQYFTYNQNVWMAGINAAW